MGTGEQSPVAIFATTGAAACTTPTNSGATAVLANSATLNWSDESADSYQINYWQKGGGSFNATAATNSFDATSLVANTQYGYRVRSICSGTPSDWSNIRGFVTPASATGTDLAAARLGSKNNPIAVYPNPSNGEVNINFLAEGMIDLQVMDVTGKVIFNKVYNDQISSTLDMSNKSRGVYILKVTSKEGSVTKQIVIE